MLGCNRGCWSFSESTNLDELKGLARTLNDLLKPAQLAIKHRLCEDTNTDIFVLISLTETEAAKYIAIIFFDLHSSISVT